MVEDTLREVASTAVEFYADRFPMAASLFADPQLLAAHRMALRDRGAGPAHASVLLGGYLTAERDLGRVAADQHAFLGHFSDDLPAEPDTAALVATLMRGLSVVDETITP